VNPTGHGKHQPIAQISNTRVIDPAAVAGGSVESLIIVGTPAKSDVSGQLVNEVWREGDIP
jgi:hypothetical protein